MPFQNIVLALLSSEFLKRHFEYKDLLFDDNCLPAAKSNWVFITVCPGVET